MLSDVDMSDPPWWLVTGCYLASLVGVFVTFQALAYFWGDYVLLEFSDLEGAGEVVWAGVGKVWFIFVWAVAVTGVLAIRSRDLFDRSDAGPIFVKGSWGSLNAGVFEELIYRWLLFFIAMIMLPFGNYMTFGLLKWFYETVLVPLANLATFGALEAQLLQPDNWVFGAALVSASISFRDAHEHLGHFGWVNAWFGGMVMFYLVFNYGILTAMTAHVLYDVTIYAVIALAHLAQPRRTSHSYW